MDFDADIKLMMADFGVTATYFGATIRALIDHNVEVVNEFGQVVERRTVATFARSDMPSPARGAPVVIAGRAYTMDGIESDDGHIVKVWLR